MGLLKIDKEKCLGCGACIDACPYGALDLVDDVVVVNEKCTACGACIDACPVMALLIPRLSGGDAERLSAYRVSGSGSSSSMGGCAKSPRKLLGQGRRLADTRGTALTACVLGRNVEHIAGEAVSYGADRVFLADDPLFESYRTIPYAGTLLGLVREHMPEIFLLGASARGRDLAGAMAADLHTGLTADCTGLDIDADTGLLLQTRPAFGGNIMATILCRDYRPQMATVRHHVFELPIPDRTRQGQIVRVAPARPEEKVPTRVVGFTEETETVHLANAKVIVAGGRGVGSAAGFEPIRRLADMLGGAVGGPAQPWTPAGSPMPTKWADRPHRSAGPVYRLRHLRRDPAPGGDEDVPGHRRHQQESGRPDLPGRKLRDRRRPLRGDSGPDR